MADTIRTEYRAIALDPNPRIREGLDALITDRSGDRDDYEGEVCSSPHAAHLSLEERWDVGDREVVVEKRTVRESDWKRIEA